ncbi:MAG TPA: DUF1573 domain-containing protein [Flavisolibacter sp.]|jgi:hypothetical protein|nr:DUF1573 domain-containing protein [Flavisolibacter sp.]
MKKLLLFAGLFGALVVNAQDKKAEEVVKVNSETHDFGKIKQGVPVTTDFVLNNISGQPLIIENVTAGCGCTTPEWSKEPVLAGGSTKIKVGFNAAAMGPVNKEVYIKIAGVSLPKVIKITGEVVDAAQFDATAKAGKKSESGKTADASKIKSKTATKKIKSKIG